MEWFIILICFLVVIMIPNVIQLNVKGILKIRQK